MKNPDRLLTILAAAIMAGAPLALHASEPVDVQPINGSLTAKNEQLLSRDYLLGSLWGTRDDLLGKGISYDLQYVNDFFGLASGKNVSDGRSADFGRVRLTLDIDLEKLAGIPGLTFHVSAINQTGGNAGKNLGTYANPSSIMGENTTRVDTYWLQEALFNKVLVLRAGQLAQQDNYGVQEYGGSFLLEPLGYAFGNLFGNVNATFDPASKPGAEILINPAKGFYAKSMFQGGDPNPYGNDRNGLAFNLSGAGVLASEIGYRTEGSSITEPKPSISSKDKEMKAPITDDGIKTLFEGLPAVYKLGLYNNFGNFTNPSNGHIVRGNYLLYGMINQAIFREGHYGEAAKKGLDAFVGADLSPSDVNFAYFELTTGIRYTGLIPQRKNDVAALGLVLTDFSHNYNTSSTHYSSETAVEVNYKVQLTPWFYVQPDMQVFANPGGQSQATDLLLGVRANVVF